jgi:N-acetylneuraminic acid mutarotase
VIVGSLSGASVKSALPNAQHDAEASLIGGRVYVFGGGQFSQYSHIIAFDPASNSVSTVGSLPSAESDVAVTGDGTHAYVVGGFDGTNSLDTVVSWQPGASPQIVAHLPVELRYASVAMAGGSLLIAGGSTPNGEASDVVYRYTPGSRTVGVLGHLPRPLTHAGAAVLDGTMFLVGGRGADTTSQTADVLAVSPVTGAVRKVAQLPQPLSDAGVVAAAGGIVVAGGRTAGGTQAAVGELVPSG